MKIEGQKQKKAHLKAPSYIVSAIRSQLFVSKHGRHLRVEYPTIFEDHDTWAIVANVIEGLDKEKNIWKQLAISCNISEFETRTNPKESIIAKLEVEVQELLKGAAK